MNRQNRLFNPDILIEPRSTVENLEEGTIWQQEAAKEVIGLSNLFATGPTISTLHTYYDSDIGGFTLAPDL